MDLTDSQIEALHTLLEDATIEIRHGTSQYDGDTADEISTLYEMVTAEARLRQLEWVLH